MKKLLIFALASSSFLISDLSHAAQPQNASYPSNEVSVTNKDLIVDKTKGTATKSPNTIKYDAFMKAGYAAYNKKDYKTALSNFKSALELRPNNVYAVKAIQNTEKRLAGK
ncbi:tetratricopeptide repeat protein [Pseudanabaena sp. UWO310]|uniref:tetratricopeptide repeat protein n=1 Tax=Pseudanabaena sp. UWO310 TaxID=2480795 RepID=UPI0011575011|nr:tetratricopeptide repeat protein [Pseudanabaena sp. UWO310]TYQ29315.1 hypothetical protein PseudUWO310_13065 [Pseudanabaena sp. UWO310]